MKIIIISMIRVYIKIWKGVLISLFDKIIKKSLTQSLNFVYGNIDGSTQYEVKETVVEVKERPQERGESNRIQFSTQKGPWTLLPEVSSFQLNTENQNTKNLILELFGLLSSTEKIKVFEEIKDLIGEKSLARLGAKKGDTVPKNKKTQSGKVI